MTANQVDAALAAHPRDRGRLLLEVTEDQWFERKSSRIAPKDLARPLIALANAEGGVIVVGLHGGKVEGVRSNPTRINEFRQVAIDYTVPPVRTHIEEVECVSEAGKPDALLIMRIDPSERIHELQSGEVYLRVGDESRKLGFAARQELSYDKGQAQYDGQVATAALLSELDEELIENYRSRTGATGNTRSPFAARRLLTSNGYLTNAGYLLSPLNLKRNFLRPTSESSGTSRLSVELDHGSKSKKAQTSESRAPSPAPSSAPAARSTNSYQDAELSISPASSKPPRSSLATLGWKASSTQ